MNKLGFILKAKNQYNIQSPFLYGLFCDVISPSLDRDTLRHLGIHTCDRYSQLLYKLQDHYGSRALDKGTFLDNCDSTLLLPDGSFVSMVRQPHRSAAAEGLWLTLVDDQAVTLSIDLFYAGMLFSSPKLTKQHILLNTYLFP